MNTATIQRKRINFMADTSLLEEMEELVPGGSRSDFINEAIEQFLTRFSKKAAREEAAVLREKLNLKIGSNEALYKKIRAGRL